LHESHPAWLRRTSDSSRTGICPRRAVHGRSETLLAVGELIEEIIDRLDSDGVAEDDELRTLVAMLRGAVFQMLNDAGATGD